MNRVTAAKIACAVVGVLLFLFGIRAEEPAYRWAGIGLVAIAFALRFVRGGASRR